MAQRWTPEEEEFLFRLICHNWLNIRAVPGRRLTNQTPVMCEIHGKFVQKFNSLRDVQALIGKLDSFRSQGSSGTKFGNYNPATETLIINKQSLDGDPRAFDWGPKHLFSPLHDEVKKTILDTFEAVIITGESDVQKISIKIAETIKREHSRLRTPHTPLRVVRLLMKHGKVIDNYGRYTLPPDGNVSLTAHQRFAEQIKQQ